MRFGFEEREPGEYFDYAEAERLRKRSQNRPLSVINKELREAATEAQKEDSRRARLQARVAGQGMGGASFVHRIESLRSP